MKASGIPLQTLLNLCSNRTLLEYVMHKLSKVHQQEAKRFQAKASLDAKTSSSSSGLPFSPLPATAKGSTVPQPDPLIAQIMRLRAERPELCSLIEKVLLLEIERPKLFAGLEALFDSILEKLKVNE